MQPLPVAAVQKTPVFLASGATLYNTLLVIAPDGRLEGHVYVIGCCTLRAPTCSS